jgi:transcriptional regulator GlxA family with amidase domain
MTQLAILLVEEMTQSAQRQTRSDGLVPTITLQRIQAYAQTHIARQLSMEELAGSASCSEASVYRLFREHVHTTPGRWLTRLRMERAASLLRTSTLSVREIGERVGFTDPFHFSRVFKRERGVSPRTYRDRLLIL